MLIQKILETRLDLAKHEDIYNPDLIKVCMDHLTKKLVGKCYKSCLVMKITKILRHSQRYMSDDLSGSAYLYVNFEVDGIIYNRGEIINGCLIVKIEADGRIHAKSPYAGVQVRQDVSLVNIYKEGQVVPFITKRVLYNPAQSAISVEAIPFTPIFPVSCIYKIGKPLDEEELLRITYLLSKLQEVLLDIDQLDPKKKQALHFFQELLYPFKKPTEFSLDGFTETKFEIQNFEKIKSGFMVKPTELKLQNHSFYYSDDHVEFLCEKDLVFILDEYLNQTILYYSELVNFTKIYPTFEKVQEYKDIWRMYNMLKR